MVFGFDVLRSLFIGGRRDEHGASVDPTMNGSGTMNGMKRTTDGPGNLKRNMKGQGVTGLTGQATAQRLAMKPLHHHKQVLFPLPFQAADFEHWNQVLVLERSRSLHLGDDGACLVLRQLRQKYFDRNGAVRLALVGLVHGALRTASQDLAKSISPERLPS